MEAARLAPIYRMQIEGDEAAGQISFDAMAMGVSHLGTVLEGGRMQAALEAALRARPSIAIRAPAQILGIEWTAQGVEIRVSEGDPLQGRLLLGADGAESMVRARAGIDVRYRGYSQEGIVTNFQAEIPHGGRAFQWFRADGVLAFLPLPGRALSIVWSTDPERAARFKSMPPAAFAAEVQAASGGVLGALTPLSKVAGFPLKYARAERPIGHRLALLGDASHSVHPLAGQGVNLGFRDVADLAKLLKERPAGTDVASSSLLRQYEKARRHDTMSMVAVTDGLQRLFGATHPILRMIRSRGMSVLDHFSILKRALMRQAML